MNKLDKKQVSTTPENWEEFRPETLLFATEVCMMDRNTKTIGAGDTGGWGALAGAVVGLIVVGLLLASFQIMDSIQSPAQNTFKDFAPWKSTRISPVTQVAIGPATKPQKPAVVAPPPKPPALKPVVAEEPPKAEVKAAAEAKAAEEAAQATAEAKAAEEAAQATAEAKAAEEAAQAAAEAKAAEEAAQAAAEAKAAEEAAQVAAEAKAAEEAAQAAAEAKAAEEAAQAAAEVKAAEEAARVAAEAKAIKEAAQAKADVSNAVKSWAAAWSDQKVDAYIDSYTSDFKPQQYKSHEYWEAQRRRRLSKPSSISVQLSNIQVSLAEDGTATVTFVQIYKSPTFSDSVRKTLLLKQEAGSWKISSEISKNL